jgi:ribosomal protein S18 acetylase RimI-like enzyme
MDIQIPSNSSVHLVTHPLICAEADAAYAIIVEAAQWLQARGLPSWCMPRVLFESRLEQGSFYGAYVGQELAGVMSLINEYRPTPWSDLLPQSRFLWFSSLTVARRFAGQGVGTFLLNAADQIARQKSFEHLILDCYYGDGELPAYYKRHGYIWIERRVNIYDDGIEHDDVLMYKRILALQRVSAK